MNDADRPPCPGPIDLRPEERALYGRVESDPEAAVELMRSLLERGAIPAIRRRYFTDPEFAIGISCSRKEVFERNGTRGENIFRHPNFGKYLRYFVCGPDLPRQVIEAFYQQVMSERFLSSGDMDGLMTLARRLTRQHGLDPKVACEEFHKLALETFGIMRDGEYDLAGSESKARSIRDYVKKT